jgi:hypothetical protein
MSESSASVEVHRAAGQLRAPMCWGRSKGIVRERSNTDSWNEQYIESSMHSAADASCCAH